MDRARLEERTREWLKVNATPALRSTVETLPEKTAALELQGVLACARRYERLARVGSRFCAVEFTEYFVVGTN